MSEATFVLCIEQTGIREQALLLCESVRAFAGPQAAAPIVAGGPDLVAARAGRVPRLAPIHVHYHWMFTAPYYRTACDTLRALAVPADRQAWLEARLPIA